MITTSMATTRVWRRKLISGRFLVNYRRDNKNFYSYEELPNGEKVYELIYNSLTFRDVVKHEPKRIKG